jgi:ATP-dependent Clp protease adaptor protein ClpS
MSRPFEIFQEDTDVLEDIGLEHHLILHNDDYNTFDFVIEALIDVCNHTEHQAEQCALIVHYKGKCSVRTGATGILKPMKEALLDRGLNATID